MGISFLCLGNKRVNESFFAAEEKWRDSGVLTAKLLSRGRCPVFHEAFYYEKNDLFYEHILNIGVYNGKFLFL